MKKRTQHSSVADMVRDLSEDRAFADEFTKRLAGRRLIKVLTVLRARAGLSQQDLAGKLGCTQSKVSKLEAGDDADVRFGDLVAYAEVVGHDMRIFLVPKGQTIVDEVKVYGVAIKRLLHRLVELAGDDKEVARGVQDFLFEAGYNLGRLVEGAALKLPQLREKAPSPLQVEAPEVADGPHAEAGGADRRAASR